MSKYKVGDRVDVNPSGEQEFSGVVTGFRNGFIQIRDQEDDVWEYEETEVSLPKEE